MRRAGFTRICRADDVPCDGGVCALVDGVQIAVFRHDAVGRWFAVQNRCPHWNEMVLWRGLLALRDGEARVVCPLHKRSFRLADGACAGDDLPALKTFAVEIDSEGWVWVERPDPATRRREERAIAGGRCGAGTTP